ncbi:hypothetical protein, partial [Acetomicrobium mobile]|uniref:hypothetical protein n=1 Tax=Acetomicrobium mobile TaxID=97477 RepID=UPI0026F1426C
MSAETYKKRRSMANISAFSTFGLMIEYNRPIHAGALHPSGRVTKLKFSQTEAWHEKGRNGLRLRRDPRGSG